MSGRDSVPPLRGRCTSCLSPNGALFILDDGRGIHLCRKCAQQQALWQVADEQLQALLLPSFEIWHDLWGNVPGLSTGSEALDGLSERLSLLMWERRKERKE